MPRSVPTVKTGTMFGMMEPSGGLGLDLEPLELACVEGTCRRQYLMRNPALERDLVALVNDAHAAAPDFLDELVVAKAAELTEQIGGRRTAVCITMRPAPHAGHQRESREHPAERLSLLWMFFTELGPVDGLALPDAYGEVGGPLDEERFVVGVWLVRATTSKPLLIAGARPSPGIRSVS